MPAIESPCIKVCTLDEATRTCLGCGRTLAEIGGWARMTAAERRTVMEDLPRRRKTGPNAARETAR